MELTTPRLIIRQPSVQEAEQFVEAVAESTASLQPWMAWADHVPTLAEARENLARAEQAFREGKDFRLHLFLRDSCMLIGGSGLHRWNPARHLHFFQDLGSLTQPVHKRGSAKPCGASRSPPRKQKAPPAGRKGEDGSVVA